MKRRALLVAAAAATTTSVAGCLADAPGAEPEPDADGTPTSTPYRRLVDQTFEVERVECGNEYGSHDVTSGDDVVTIEGVLDGRNTCYTAELVTAEYDSDADELYVDIASVEKDDSEGCATCIVEIEYVATFTFENGTPSSIRVEQRGATSGSASSSQSVSGSGSGGEPTATPSPSDSA
ncbi:MAG: hypothetical protein ACI8UR_000748 [Natronomonas sp.]|uniref:hypothetical protein n=1 Tax=Natronomonas sp. TaxID=2184060 RepID=UPI003989126A